MLEPLEPLEPTLRRYKKFKIFIQRKLKQMTPLIVCVSTGRNGFFGFSLPIGLQ